MNRATVLVLLGGLALTAVFVFAPREGKSAGAFVPRDDAEVLETVPKGVPRTTGVKLNEVDAAVQAKALIVEARKRGGDPRLLGRAQAVLAPWWQGDTAPHELRLLRATLKQSLHDFDGAQADLDALVREDPSDSQAWLTRATVSFVQAKYEAARESCSHLDDELAVLCAAPVNAVAKPLETAEVLGKLRRDDAWARSLRGEALLWAGKEEEAEVALRGALSVDPDDTYSRLLLAELLVDRRAFAQAAALFDGREVNDSELLMLVLALQPSGSKAYVARRAELDERVAANRQRGETLHRREESRYALRLEGDGAKALSLAKENWAVQREPADARVLLEAAGDRASAAPVLDWMKTNAVAWPRLNELAGRLK